MLFRSDFGSGHVLMVCGFEPYIGLCADSSEPGACFGFCVSLSICRCPTCVLSLTQKLIHRGAWVAQSVKRLTSAQVTILRLVSSSPASGSALTAQSLEPASDSMSPSLSLCPFPTHTLSFSLSLHLPFSLSLSLSLSLKNE